MFIASKLPEFQLKMRTNLIRSESEEDCLQLQTITGIMMHTNIDTLDLLDWYAQHSRVFKGILLEAYHNYPSNPERTLRILKEKSATVEFKALVDRLELTRHQLTIAEAFADTQSERHHLLSMRETAQLYAIRKKRSLMSAPAMMPLWVIIIGYTMIPLGYVMIKDITNFLTTFGSYF